MKNYFGKAFSQYDKVFIALALGLTLLVSCKDDYFYDNKEPEWLGSSIYNYLKEDGHFTNYVKLINDLGYSEDLQGGSMTLFVANDSSFNEFYKKNVWGVTKYEGLSLQQKKMLLKFSLLSDGFVLEKMANFYNNKTQIYYEGAAMRRQTSLSVIDSVSHDKNEDVPDAKYWQAYRNDRGIYLLKGNDLTDRYNGNDIPFVFTTQFLMDKYSFTSEDFQKMFGVERNKDDVYLFNNKVIKRDIVCKNGYIHVLRDVMVPPTNMAQFIKENSKSSIPATENTSIFSKLLDRFSAPQFDPNNTTSYRILHPEFTDSIFTKRYFTSSIASRTLPNGTLASLFLPFDPGLNNYSNSALEADMATIFAPSDAAMKSYFSANAVGKIMYERFKSWDSIPDEIVLPFIRRHMRTSLIESVPSKFSKMVDEQNYSLPVEKGHIVKSYTGVNGEVFVTSNVYPPVDYISVYSPILLSANTKVMNWAINISEQSKIDNSYFAFYKLYLNSLAAKYTLFIPTDEALTNSSTMYIDPIAYGQTVPAAIKFWYNDKQITPAVNATVYKYDKVNDLVLDQVDEISDAAFMKDRLWKFLDSHVIIGNLTPSKKYYVTKGNDIVYVDGTGLDMKIKGGEDIYKDKPSKVINVYPQDNGNTYFIDKPINSSMRSVYKILSETPEFQTFFDLINDIPSAIDGMKDTKGNNMLDSVQMLVQQGVDYRIKIFNAYRYTIYVPTKTAIETAISQGIITPWSEILKIQDKNTKWQAIKKMVRFIRYHFQDEAVFCGQDASGQYQSGTIKTSTESTVFGTSKDKYFKIGVENTSDGGLELTMESKKGDPVRKANVKPTNLNNIIAKDYIFGKVPTTGYKNIDGTGPAAGALFNSSRITASASAVIHQIDNVLTFE